MGRSGFYSRLVDKRNERKFRVGGKAAFKWFDKQVGDIKGINRKSLLKADQFKITKQPRIGRMYMYSYDAKHKETLPFFDRFPLIFLVKPAEGGWYGINMHYYPPVMRARLFDKLLELANNDRYDETTKLRLSYDILNSLSRVREFQLGFKRYLGSQLKSAFVEVPASEWENVMYLPTDRFIGQQRQSVWNGIKKEYRNLK